MDIIAIENLSTLCMQKFASSSLRLDDCDNRLHGEFACMLKAIAVCQ